MSGLVALAARPHRIVAVLGILALLALVTAAVLWLRPSSATATGGNSITSPDSGGWIGWYSSLALDDLGNPVVSYYSKTNFDLKVLHCNDANCAGGDESITAPDALGDVGMYTSLALDASGNPVISYYDDWNDLLKVAHCNDPNCSGDDESITSPDTGQFGGWDTSLSLDSSGNPVISYFNLWPENELRVLHCNDPNCAGGDESSTSPDTVGDVGWYTSLALDGAGKPLFSYFDYTNEDLRLLHCNDPNCAGGDESVTSPDTLGDVGEYTSLALDASGHPVVSYFDATNGDLKVLHCNDPDCSGDDESITAPDTGASVGLFTSLALDAAGNPVVSYHDVVNGDLKVLRCNDADCAGGDESIASPDTIGDVGWYTSLELDASGFPVVGYYGSTDLRVLHCSDAGCVGSEPKPTPTTAPTPLPGLDFSMAIDADGDTTEDCGTGVGQSSTCSVTPASTFALTIYLNGLPSGVSAYGGFDVYLEYTGVSSEDNPDTGAWPDCAIPVSFAGPGWLGFGCAIFGLPSPYVGPIGTTDFNCAESGTITMVHGDGRTTLTEQPGIVHVEGEGTAETLTINCGAPTAMPTATPTATPTPPPAPRMRKEPALRNLFLTRQGDEIPPLNCLEGDDVATLEHRLSGPIPHAPDPKDPSRDQQIGAFEFELHYDDTKVCVELEAGPAAQDMICVVEDSTNSTVEGVARIGCVTQGKDTFPDTDSDEGRHLANVLIRPQPEIYSQAKPNQYNGVVVQLNNVGCELADLQGHPIEVFSCEDADLTVRYLEGDVTADCSVDTLDTQAIAFRWGTEKGSLVYSDFMNLEPSGAQADEDIDIKDLQFVFGRFGSTCAHPHPEQPPVNPKAEPTPTPTPTDTPSPGPTPAITHTPGPTDTPPPTYPVSGNDDFIDAWPVPSLPFVGVQSTVGMTTEPGEPLGPAGCMAVPPQVMGATVWYQFTPSASGTVFAGTAGSNFDTVLAAYTGGEPAALTPVACDDDSGPGLTSEVSFPVTAGITYHLQVGGFNGATGSLRLTVAD